MSGTIISHNNKGQLHGYWEYYYWDGDLAYKCLWNNDMLVGYKEQYFYFGADDHSKQYTLS